LTARKQESADRQNGLPRDAAGRCRGCWLLLLTISILVLAADLTSKQAAFQHVAGQPITIDKQQVLAETFTLPPHRGIEIIPRILDLKLVVNRGAVFGVGHGGRWFFAGFTIVALFAALAMFAGWMKRSERMAQVSVALILAGGMGNLYDRIVFACVRDFLHLFPSTRLFPWVFNIADASLLFGIGLLMIHFWRKDRRLAKERSAQTKGR